MDGINSCQKIKVIARLFESERRIAMISEAHEDAWEANVGRWEGC